jgi:hypothetical protein
MLEDGVPLHLVQYAVGHSDGKTTIRYWRTKGKLDDSPLYDLAASYYGTPTDERSETCDWSPQTRTTSQWRRPPCPHSDKARTPSKGSTTNHR